MSAARILANYVEERQKGEDTTAPTVGVYQALSRGQIFAEEVTKESLMAYLIHDFSNQHGSIEQKAAVSAMVDAILSGLLTQAEMIFLFSYSDNHGWTPLQTLIARHKLSVDQRLRVLDAVLLHCPDALCWQSEDGWSPYRLMACELYALMDIYLRSGFLKSALERLDDLHGAYVLASLLSNSDEEFVRGVINALTVDCLIALRQPVAVKHESIMPLHMLVKKHPGLVPDLLEKFPRHGRALLATNNTKGYVPLCMMMCWATNVLLENAPRVIAVVPDAFLITNVGGIEYSPLHVLANASQAYHHRFFQLLPLLGEERFKALNSAKTIRTPLPLTLLGIKKSKVLLQRLDELTADELLISDSTNNSTVVHRIAVYAPEVLMSIFDSLGDRLGSLLSVKVTNLNDDPSSEANFKDVLLAAGGAPSSTLAFVEALLADSQVTFLTSLRGVEVLGLTENLKAQLLKHLDEIHPGWLDDLAVSKVLIQLGLCEPLSSAGDGVPAGSMPGGAATAFLDLEVANVSGRGIELHPMGGSVKT